MFRCRLIRTVVNLSLIVAMMIQPGMALVFASDCGANCASAFMCDGCGCCEVASPEEKCCCCGGGELAEGGKSCCMGGAESESSWDSPGEMLQAGDTLKLQVIVLTTTEPSVTVESDSAIGNAMVDVHVTSRCGCGVESPPLSESTPARPTVPTRESVAIRHADSADLFGGLVLPRRSYSVRGENFLRPHFSQIQLCIWRL